MKASSAKAIFRALDQRGVKYLVADGIAVNAYGYLRFTKDIDFVIQLLPENIAQAFGALASIGYVQTYRSRLKNSPSQQTASAGSLHLPLSRADAISHELLMHCAGVPHRKRLTIETHANSSFRFIESDRLALAHYT